jgi:hypothetical protein
MVESHSATPQGSHEYKMRLQPVENILSETVPNVITKSALLMHFQY